MQERYPTLCQSMLAPDRYRHPTEEPPLCLSGACEGADEFFGCMAPSVGHLVAHVMGPRNVPSEMCASAQSHALYNVSDELLHDAQIDAAMQQAIAKRAGVASNMNGWLEDSRRNYLQVCCAEACVCVSYRNKASEEVVSKLDIGGGTGYAAQWYVDRFQPTGPEEPAHCHLYLWDDGNPSVPTCLIDPATHHRWNRWEDERWVPLADGEGPPLSNFRVYAGIGATRLSEAGLAAIRDLYKGLPSGEPET